MWGNWTIVAPNGSMAEPRCGHTLTLIGNQDKNTLLVSFGETAKTSPAQHRCFENAPSSDNDTKFLKR